MNIHEKFLLDAFLGLNCRKNIRKKQLRKFHMTIYFQDFQYKLSFLSPRAAKYLSAFFKPRSSVFSNVADSFSSPSIINFLLYSSSGYTSLYCPITVFANSGIIFLSNRFLLCLIALRINLLTIYPCSAFDGLIAFGSPSINVTARVWSQIMRYCLSLLGEISIFVN